jgi:DNA mismatch repair protein MutL
VAGWRLVVDGGVEREAGECGAPVGTQVVVRDLLHNVPARLKFLKAESTEAAHVTEAVTRLALAHPAVHFRLRHGGRVAIDLPPNTSADSGLERIKAALGRRLAARVCDGEHEEGGVRVSCFLLPPDEAQTTSRGIQLFVGRRFVRDRGLLHAVAMGYGELLPAGRYATAIVFVEPAPGTVDVNVHPQKTEVRFARPQEIFAAVRHGVARVVARAPWLGEQPGATAAPVSMYAMTSHAPPLQMSELAASYADHQARLFAPGPAPMAARAPLPSRGDPAPVARAAPAAARDFFGSLTYLGQLDRTYLVCEAYGELVLLDQHAAHERIAFQRLREAYNDRDKRAPPTQRMLIPATVELDDAQAAAAEESGEALGAIGYEVERLSGRTWAVRAAPAELRDEEITATLVELLGDLAEAGGSRAAADRLDHVFATVACHSVVRAGDLLTADEARALLEALDGVDYKAHCPHGRPVLLRISVAEIARRFGRT